MVQKKISDTFFDIVAPIVEANDDGILYSNTEELLEAFEDLNKNAVNRDRVVGSMDAISLYTSLEAERSADILKEEVLRSKVKFDNIDTHKLGIYIRKHLPKEYIESKKYDDILPKKKIHQIQLKKQTNICLQLSPH